MKPHKHAELIKAWADGAEIQAKDMRDNWHDVLKPNWDEECEYRIKPELKEDIVLYSAVHKVNPHKSGSFAWVSCAYPDYQDDAKLKLTFDSETGELKSAEVIK